MAGRSLVRAPPLAATGITACVGLVLQRLEGLPEVFASPVGAGGRVYIAGRDRVILVIRHGKTYEVLAANKLDDGFDASPALVDGAIYLRGYRNLYCITTN